MLQELGKIRQELNLYYTLERNIKKNHHFQLLIQYVENK